MILRGSMYFSEEEFSEITNGVTDAPECFGFIYIWRHRESGKGYVGKWENTVRKLCMRYAKEIAKPYVKNRAIINAMRHYGLTAFSLEILHVGYDRKNLFDFEKYYIALLETKTVQHGYNCTGGGDGGDTFTWKSDEAKAATRKKLSENNARKPCSEEHKEYMRQLFRGRPIPQWQRDQIASSLRGRKQSDETKLKRKESMRLAGVFDGIPLNDEQKEFIRKYQHLGCHTLAHKFNRKFGTSHSGTPFSRIKKQLKCQYAHPDIFQNQS